MTDIQDQVRKVAEAARDVLESGWSKTQQTGVMARDYSSDAVERALDGIFDEPYSVPDAETARQLVTDASLKQASAVWAVLEGFALARLVRLIARYSKFSVSSALIAAAPTAVRGIRHAVADGLSQLRVLASFLVSRARAEGVVLDKDVIRAATVELYLDPRADVTLRYTGHRAGRAVATRWARDATTNLSERKHAELVDARIAAIARLDLRELERRIPTKAIEPT